MTNWQKVIAKKDAKKSAAINQVVTEQNSDAKAYMNISILWTELFHKFAYPQNNFKNKLLNFPAFSLFFSGSYNILGGRY